MIKIDKLEFLGKDTIKVRKNNTSLYITIPSKWKELHGIDDGDWIDIELITVRKKNVN